MKKGFKNILIGIITFILIACSVNVYVTAEIKGETYSKTYLKILQTMKKGMLNANKTGDVTIDFLCEIIPHHEAAISMSKNVLKYVSYPKVKIMAERIIEDKSKTIEKIKVLYNSLKDNPKPNLAKQVEYFKVCKEPYENMILGMEAVKDQENIDKEFLQQMILHHEGCINISKNILKFTDNKKVNNIAKNIIYTETREIKQMKKLLKTIK